MRRQIMSTVKKITQAFKDALGFRVFWAVALSYLALAAVVFYPVLRSGLFLAYDFLTGIYPPNEVIRTGFMAWYTPYIYGGVDVLPLHYFQPMMALVRWLTPDSHNSIVLIFVHVWLAGIGMFLFLRRWYGDKGAVFGGVAYMFTGMLCSLVFAGHEGKIMVSAYLPWLFWCIDGMTSDPGWEAINSRLWITGPIKKLWPWALAAGLIGGMAATTFHIQMSYYVIVFSLIYYAFRVTKRSLLLVLAALLISGAMFAPLYQASKRVLANSTRAEGRSYERAVSYSMPPEEIFCIAEPGLRGERYEYFGRRGLKQHTEYMGWLVVAAMLFSLLFKSRLRWPMVAVGLTSLAFALGGYTPLYKLIYHIPPNGMFRSPGMAFIGFAFAGCALAAGAVKTKWPWLVVLAITIATFGDLWIVNYDYIRPTTFSQVYGETEDVARFLQAQPGDFRVWPIPRDISDNRWGYYKIKSIGGNYPMPRAAFVDSVGRKPEGILPDYHLMTPQRVREMNVKYIISDYPLTVEGASEEIKLVFTGAKYLVYEIQ